MLPEQMQKCNGDRAKKRETKPKWKEKGRTKQEMCIMSGEKRSWHFKPKIQISGYKRNMGWYYFCRSEVPHRLEPRGVGLFVVFEGNPGWNLTHLSCNSGGLQWLSPQLSKGQSPTLIISAPFALRCCGAVEVCQIYNSWISSPLLMLL